MDEAAPSLDPAPGAAPSHEARKPILFVVDDDLSALAALERAKLGNAQVALLLVDQRMPDMSGLDFLAKARELYPAAKRVLRTAYADSQASIQAINETQLDYYLLKPWDPPEEHLYPVIDDLLDDWRAAFPPSFTGVTLVGHLYSARAHELKEFLGRNLVPYRWLDVERSREAEELLRLAGADSKELPLLLLLPDGSALKRPTVADVAARIGLRSTPELQLYDLVI